MNYPDKHLHLYHLILNRPPNYALFPYTTLFRSSLVRRLSCGREHHTLGDPASVPRAVYVEPCNLHGRRPRDEGRNPSAQPDRKSTRLNSSHSQISYAVFCLKKKNN